MHEKESQMVRCMIREITNAEKQQNVCNQRHSQIQDTTGKEIKVFHTSGWGGSSAGSKQSPSGYSILKTSESLDCFTRDLILFFRSCEVSTAASRLKGRKSPGPDGLMAEHPKLEGKLWSFG